VIMFGIYFATLIMTTDIINHTATNDIILTVRDHKFMGKSIPGILRILVSYTFPMSFPFDGKSRLLCCVTA
jgi:hypothetical protein